MAEAPIEWKIETLRALIAAPPHSRLAPRPDTEEMAWIIDLKNDGLIEGSWGREMSLEAIRNSIVTGHVAPLGNMSDGREVFADAYVTEKGKNFVGHYDSRQKATEDFKTLDGRKLLKMDDKELADWQSRYKPDQAQFILAEQEWKRRAGISTRRIAILAIIVSAISLGFTAYSYFYPKSPPADAGTTTPAPSVQGLKPPTPQSK